MEPGCLRFSYELSGPKGEAHIEPVNYPHKDLEITRVPDLTPKLTCPITYLCLTWKTALPCPHLGAVEPHAWDLALTCQPELCLGLPLPSPSEPPL